MRFHWNGKWIEKHTVLGDDTARDAALKLTLGAGNVYLYAKQTFTTTAVQVWEKFDRPLTVAEMSAELRNVGIKKRIEIKTYDFKDVAAVFTNAEWRYIPFGQTLPAGVRVKPPQHSYEMCEFENVLGTVDPHQRLFDFKDITDVYAVSLPVLHHVYLHHAPGVFTDDVFLLEAVSTADWETLPVVRYLPLKEQPIDLQFVFQRVHASSLVPYISFGKLLRSVEKSFSFFKPKKEGLTVYLDHNYITFFENAETATPLEPAYANPIINYVNNVLKWKTGLESDYQLLGKKVERSDLFSFEFFPLCGDKFEKRVSISLPWDGDFPETVGTVWSSCFTQDFKYKRCSPPGKLLQTEHSVVVTNLPEACVPFAQKYVESLLSHTSDYLHVIEEEVQTEPKPTMVGRFKKAGYEIGDRFRNGFTAFDPDGLEGFVPCVEKQTSHGVLDSLLSEWVPYFKYKKVKLFLEKASSVLKELTPTARVNNSTGHCVGVLLSNGVVVKCLKETVQVDDLPFKTENEIKFPNDSRAYATFKEKFRQSNGKASDSSFNAKLSDEIARFHHVRSHVFNWLVTIDGVDYDLLPGETLN